MLMTHSFDLVSFHFEVRCTKKNTINGDSRREPNASSNIYRSFCWSVKLRNALTHGDIKWLWGLYIRSQPGGNEYTTLCISQKNKNIKWGLLFEEWFYKMFHQRGSISYLNWFRLKRKKEIIFILTQGEEYQDKQLK